VNLEQARTLLAGARRVAVLTGAGISAESGIPTFRDAQSGHWARFRPEDLASPEAYWRDPVLVWAWYAGRYRDVMAARPNSGHTRLAALEQRVGAGYTLITQNVDGLHARAGSAAPLELHGNLTHSRCEVCRTVSPLPAPDDFVPPPRCPVCGGRGRPNVVWFGELLPEAVLQQAQRACAAAELTLVIGTSSQVYPAADLARLTLRGGGTVIEINPDVTPLSAQAHLHLALGAGEALAQLGMPELGVSEL
jgi:NAD-dependent deacetylase